MACPQFPQITIKECNNEEAQCAFVIDKIMESTSNCSASKGFGSFAVLYRRQVKLTCQYINKEKHEKFTAFILRTVFFLFL